MAELPWNTTFTSGHAWNDPDVYLPFAKALNERLRVLRTFEFDETSCAGDEALTTAMGLPLFGGGVPPVSSFIPQTESHGSANWFHDSSLAPTWDATVNSHTSGEIYSVTYQRNAISGTATPTVVSATNQTGETLVPGQSVRVQRQGNVDIGLFYIFKSDYKRPFSWKSAQYIVLNLLLYFVDSELEWEGRGVTEANDYAGYTWNTYLGQVGNFAAPSGPSVNNNILPALIWRYPKWPEPNGFTRKREREISDIMQSGSAGQRARFTVCDSTVTFQHPTVQGASLTPDLTITPTDQRENSLKFFDYNGAIWVESDDQESSADIVTYYGPAMPGDIMGAWILNELRDAINLLVWTQCTYWMTNWTRRQGSGASSAAASTAWNAAGTTSYTPTIALESPVRGWAVQTWAGGISYSLDTIKAQTYFRQSDVSGANHLLPNHVSRAFDVYFATNPPATDTGSSPEYNDEGSGYPDCTLVRVIQVASTTAEIQASTQLSTDYIGSTDIEPTVYNTTAATLFITPTRAGWNNGGLWRGPNLSPFTLQPSMIVKWDFAYIV